MFKALVLILFAVELGTGFTAASAELVSTSSNAVEVELRVELAQPAEIVLAHLAFPGTPPVLVPLVDQGLGTGFSIRAELLPINYQVTFEIVGDQGAISAPASLMNLGLVFESERQPESTSVTSVDESLGESTQRWGWLALAFGAAALSALAFWVLGGDDQSSSETDSSDDSEVAEDI